MTEPYQVDETKAEVSPTLAQEPGKETTAPEHITREEFQKFSEEIKNFLSEGFRGIQSQTDKFEKRVQQRMENLVKAAEREGVTLTDAQKSALHDTAMVQELSAEPKGKTSTVPTGLSEQLDKGQLPTDVESVNALAEGLMSTYGIEIEDEDPEADIIMRSARGTTPKQYLNAVIQAIQAKQERLSQSGAQVDQDTLRARTPGVTQGKPVANEIENITDPVELLQLARKKGEF